MTNEVNMNKPSFEDLLSKPIHINKNKDEDKKDKHNKEEKKVIYKEYFNYVEALYDEWCNRIVNYPTFKNMLKCFGSINPDLPPQFFTGDIESDVVMISLNGHAGEQSSEIDATEHCVDWTKCIDFWTDFVKNRYGEKSKYKDNPVSEFDKKLHRFLSGCNSDVKSEDLAKWNFFHMELCPFLSSSYSSAVDIEYMKNYLFRTLDAIALYERKIILVLNRQVCNILDKLDSVEKIKNTKKCTKNEIWALESRTPKKEKKSNKEKESNTQVKQKENRIDYIIQRMIYNGKSKSYELNGKALPIIAVPTFAQRSMNGKKLIDYGKNIFKDKEHEYLNKAIGVDDNA